MISNFSGCKIIGVNSSLSPDIYVDTGLSGELSFTLLGRGSRGLGSLGMLETLHLGMLG